MGDHWEMLGLEPTGDALAIKKAYAGLLKKNRPDEQPEAYQALRHAYEGALSEAEWICRPRQEGRQHEEIAQVSESTRGHDAQANLARELEPVSDFSLESERADALLNRWADKVLQCGAQDVEGCWQALSHELESLPLDEQAAASSLFADFVLQHEALPTALLVDMSGYFRWGRDYRDAEQLGAFRLAQLRERLIEDAPMLFRDAQQIERSIELLRLDWVLEHQGKLSGWLYAVLAGPHLGRLVRDSDDRTCRALDISHVRWEAIQAAALQAGLVRLLFVLAGVIPGTYLLTELGQDLSNWAAAGGFVAVLYWFLAGPIARLLPTADYMHAKLSALSWMRTDGDRIIAVNLPPLMLAGIARGAVEFPALQEAYPILGLISAALMICTFSLLAWPADQEEREIFLPMLGVFALALSTLTGTQGAGPVVALVAAAGWMGLGGWLYQQAHDRVVRFYSNPWASLRPRAWWGWTLLVVAFPVVLTALGFLLVLALPITLRVLARYMSANTALLAIGLAVALAMLAEPGSAAACASLPALALTAAALMALQALAERLSGRLFRHLPATFFQHGN